MIKSVFTALLICAVPAAAQAAASPLSFERDGVRYVGTIETSGQKTIISGKEADSGKPFHLQVVNGRVVGTYGSTPVSYSLASARAD